MNRSSERSSFKTSLCSVVLMLLTYGLQAQQTESHRSEAQGETAESKTILWQPDPGQKPVKKTVQIIDDFVIMDGDIILGRKNVIFGPRAAIITNSGRRWLNSTIPYEIQNGYPDLAMIHYAINHVINNTNLCLVPRTNETDYVRFINSGGCSSYVGRIGGMQEINVSVNCGVGSTIHEILHAAGFWHEQSRSDRDNHVIINTTNISAGNVTNFSKYSSGSDVGAYDYSSIMHYGPFAFSANGLPTIQVKIPPATSSTNIGQREGLSAGDISAVNSTYSSNPSCATLTVSPNLTVRMIGDLSIAGSTVNISNCLIENDGSSSISSSTANFFYGLQGTSTVSFFGAAKMIPALTAGQSHTLDLTHDLATLPNGTYFIGIWLNHLNNPTEVHTDDNIAIWSAPLLTLPASSCTAPSIQSVVVNQPPDCEHQTGSITINATGSAALQYSINGGSQWQASNYFENLAPGNYLIFVRLQANPACQTSYNQNPVILNPPQGCNNCFTYQASDVPKVITDTSNTISVISVAATGTITDVNIKNLQGTHTWLHDLTFILISPQGTQVVLIENICNDLNDFHINLDDQAESSVIPCPYNTGGTVRPKFSLSAFGGENPAGQWMLMVNDNASGDTGSLAGWSLELCGNFNFPDCEPVLSIDDQPIVSNTYQAGTFITSAGLVESGHNVIFKAGDHVQLQPQFEVSQSAVFEIKIEGCN